MLEWIAYNHNGAHLCIYVCTFMFVTDQRVKRPIVLKDEVGQMKLSVRPNCFQSTEEVVQSVRLRLGWDTRQFFIICSQLWG